ncbi:clavesin-1 isoform X3 [Anabrus simplex]|uniref:clavesin-1 isoform X3 n=1 Tax=Anabrus simplex TaxID=316456 RepID=UPI0034DCCA33
MEINRLDTREPPGEDPAMVQEKLEEIRRLITEQPDLKIWSDEDWYLLRFLRYRNFNPAYALRQTAFPMRLNGIHIVHQPALFSMVFSLFKGFLDERMRRRLFFHGHDLESLHEHIPANVLPPELGGDNPQPEDPHWWQCTVFGDAVTSGLKKQGIVFVNNPA